MRSCLNMECTSCMTICFLLWSIFVSTMARIDRLRRKTVKSVKVDQNDDPFNDQKQFESLDKLDALIKSGNLSHPPWFYTREPMNVTLDINLSMLRDVDPARLEVELGYFRHMKWLDKRLMYDERLSIFRPYIPWEPRFKNTVWTPDIHVSNAAKSWFHSVPSVNMIYRLYPDGTIWESASLASTLICKKAPVYPKIEFECVMRFESYGYTKSELTIDWKARYPHTRLDFFAAPTFKIKHIELKEFCEDNRKVVGIYDCIEISMVVYQQYQPFVTEIFVPSSLIVLAAWMTFWIDKNSVPARTSLGGLCVIASITHSVGLVLGLRHNIEWNSVNIWLNTCTVFVVAALLEYGIVHTLVKRANKKAQQNTERSDSCTSSKDNTDDQRETSRVNKYRALEDVSGDVFGESRETNSSAAGCSSCTSRCSPSVQRCFLLRFLKRVLTKIISNPGKVDTVMRVLYLVLYAAFTICYWVHFTRTDDVTTQPV